MENVVQNIDTRILRLVNGEQKKKYRIRRLVRGVKILRNGERSMENGVWNTEYGKWSMAYKDWGTVVIAIQKGEAGGF